MVASFRSLVVCAALLWPASASADAIVFDFEDGLQGWEPAGSVLRVQTRLLGGDWVLFGDGAIPRTHLSIELDVSNLALLTLEQFRVVAGEPAPASDFLAITVDLIGDGFSAWLLGGDPTASPGVRVFDLERARESFPLEGPAELIISWIGGPTTNPGFIDNVTFHPIPEPGTLGLLGLGIVGPVLLRRWLRE